jgi:hypothetical protein
LPSGRVWYPDFLLANGDLLEIKGNFFAQQKWDNFIIPQLKMITVGTSRTLFVMKHLPDFDTKEEFFASCEQVRFVGEIVHSPRQRVVAGRNSSDMVQKGLKA